MNVKYYYLRSLETGSELRSGLRNWFHQFLENWKPNEIYYLRIDAKMYHSFFRVMNEKEAIEELKTRQLELPLETATK